MAVTFYSILRGCINPPQFRHGAGPERQSAPGSSAVHLHERPRRAELCIFEVPAGSHGPGVAQEARREAGLLVAFQFVRTFSPA
jgi:hypothetical protein